ncbi:hypothetical protein F2P81_005230 [Scophthalmus maximus]|uniref:Tensin-3-like n=1 Tax=Scophthalmus maximus TaxID=52904 RepID=A0A6A4TB98_SCOMX|nr:hypothetical protein F2P81_005230 [Scophthalmus maximus]
MENWLQPNPKHVLVLHCRCRPLSRPLCHEEVLQRHAVRSDDAVAEAVRVDVGQFVKRTTEDVSLSDFPPLRRPSRSPHNTSGRSHVSGGRTDRLYVVLQPAQLLTGDIMVVCYDKNSRSSCRQVVFRLQFHTGLVHGHSLTFSKAELDCAAEDPRFPVDGKVELLLSESPEKITAPPRDLHPGNGSLYASVRKRSSEEGVSFPATASSPGCSDRAPSASSDSGLSLASQGWTAARRGQAGRLLSGVDFEIAQSLLEVMTELAARGGAEVEVAGDESGLGHTINGEASSGERETDILDDEDHVDEATTASALDLPSSSSICSLSSENLPETPRSARTECSTYSWSLVAPDTPTRGVSSREAAQRGPADEEGTTHHVTRDAQFAHAPHGSSGPEEDLTSLTTDVDESIEQLNQLILDLDPTFVPVPTRCSPLSRAASLHTNGLSHLGDTHLSESHNSPHIVSHCGRLRKIHLCQQVWRQMKLGGCCAARHREAFISRDEPERRRPIVEKSPPERDDCGYQRPAAMRRVTATFNLRPCVFAHVNEMSSKVPKWWNQSTGNGARVNVCVHLLHKVNSVDCQGHADRSDFVPQTPAFPVSPPTPYDARNFLDSVNHGGGGSSEGEMFRSDVSVTPASCQRVFGSMCSVSTPPPAWHDRTPGSQYPPQPSPPLSLSTPNAHSSPRGPLKSLAGGGAAAVRGEADSADLSSLLLLLGNGGLDHGLQEAMGGLGGLNLGGDGGHAPLLPEKRRVWGEGADLGSRSPSLSGFSSPHSSSSLSIPFSSSMTPDPLRGLSGAPSPGADFGSKQVTVKFVQDTSKFWYKPDISRDQAITVLKDREPGSFVVRDSHSFRGAYGLAMKVATPPPSVLQQSKKDAFCANIRTCVSAAGDLSSELVRHFLIECTQKGVRLKGCPNEPYFGSLTALVCQHSITPLALPCKLILPNRACNVWYLGSVELESLTGHQAVQKATTETLAMDPPPASTVVHFKVSLFFRRHYAVNIVIFCSLDPQGRKWSRGSASTAKIFGFVARKSQSDTENICHLFAEHDPEQPASAIVNFVSKHSLAKCRRVANPARAEGVNSPRPTRKPPGRVRLVPEVVRLTLRSGNDKAPPAAVQTFSHRRTFKSMQACSEARVTTREERTHIHLNTRPPSKNQSRHASTQTVTGEKDMRGQRSTPSLRRVTQP